MLTKKELQAEFERALKAPTSGSQGARVLRILYQLIPEEENNEIYKEVEMIATEMGNYDHSEFLSKMLSERFEILVGDYTRHAQMEIDHQKEIQWEREARKAREEWVDHDPCDALDAEGDFEV